MKNALLADDVIGTRERITLLLYHMRRSKDRQVIEQLEAELVELIHRYRAELTTRLCP